MSMHDEVLAAAKKSEARPDRWNERQCLWAARGRSFRDHPVFDPYDDMTLQDLVVIDAAGEVVEGN